MARRCPEALPTRYGSWEPPPHRFNRAEPDPFVNFVARSEDGYGFWYASKPSFGGSFIAPHADKNAKLEDERFRIGKLEISFDGNLVAADERWREGIVELFVRGAETFRAFFAAAQVEPGWTVSRNNRPWATAAVVQESEHFLRGRLWQGLPPVPIWLSFYGDPYRELVAESVHRPLQEATERPRKTLLGRLIGSAEAHPFAEHPQIDDRQDGTFVRMSRDPLPRPQLPRLPLPDELIYRERRAIDYPNGGRGTNPTKAEDRAAVIPDLEIALDRTNPD